MMTSSLLNISNTINRFITFWLSAALRENYFTLFKNFYLKIFRRNRQILEILIFR